jgi:hypothetical protein
MLLLIALAAMAGGCQAGLARPWQEADFPTHDRQHAFDAAKEAISKHFEIAEASWTRGVIETRPQVFDRKKTGTLADVRGAGGRWRRTVFFELEHSDLTIVGRVAVRLEREATDQAFASARSGGAGERPMEGPSSRPYGAQPGARQSEPVWVETGYDADLARELLAEIGQRITQQEKRESAPTGLTPQQEAEETRRLGEQGK